MLILNLVVFALILAAAIWGAVEMKRGLKILVRRDYDGAINGGEHLPEPQRVSLARFRGWLFLTVGGFLAFGGIAALVSSAPLESFYPYLLAVFGVLVVAEKFMRRKYPLNEISNAPDYTWKCHCCGSSNSAGSTACLACGFEASASAADIQRARAAFTSAGMRSRDSAS